MPIPTYIIEKLRQEKDLEPPQLELEVPSLIPSEAEVQQNNNQEPKRGVAEIDFFI